MFTGNTTNNIPFCYYHPQYTVFTNHGQDFASLWMGTTEYAFESQFKILTWFSFCFVVDGNSSTVSVYQNDIELKPNNLTDNSEKFLVPVPKDGYVLLGQGPENSFNPEAVLMGEIADVRLWPITLAVSDLLLFARCLNIIAEPILTLSNEWRVNGSASWVSTAAADNACQLQPLISSSLIFLNSYTRDKARDICTKLNGVLPVPLTQTENILLMEAIRNYGSPRNFNAIHLGIKKSYINWVSEYDETDISPPNNITSAVPKSILAFKAETGEWYEESLYSPLMVVCQVPVTNYRVRGLCPESPLKDKELWLHHTLDGRPIFRGRGTTTLKHSPKSKKWQLHDWLLSTSAIVGTDSLTELPFGKQQWKVNDFSCGTQNLTVMLTNCFSDQFTCDNLNCIPLKDVCDHVGNCPDESDETFCNEKVELPDNYVKLPPAFSSGRCSDYNLTFGVSIINYRSFDISLMQATVDLIFNIGWQDTRLTYKHLNNGSGNLMKNYLDTIWIPEFELMSDLGTKASFEDMDKDLTAELTDPLPLSDDVTKIEAGNRFDGCSVTLWLQAKTSVTYNCDANLKKFPFDVQTCKLWIRFKIPGGSRFTVGTLKNLSMHRRQLLEYEIYSLSLDIDNSVSDLMENNAYVLTTVFRHQYGYYILSIYIPTAFLVFISYISFFFDKEDFPNRIMVPLTALLVLATFLSATTSTMARVSYFTLIDIWLAFCIAYVFLICFFHTLILYIRIPTEDSDTNEGMMRTKVHPLMIRPFATLPELDKRLPHADKVFRIVLSLILALFIVIYFVSEVFTSDPHSSLGMSKPVNTNAKMIY